MDSYKEYTKTKEVLEKNKFYDKFNSKQLNVSLPMGSEERLKQLKDNFELLSTKVDKNMDNFVKYNALKDNIDHLENELINHNNKEDNYDANINNKENEMYYNQYHNNAKDINQDNIGQHNNHNGLIFNCNDNIIAANSNIDFSLPKDKDLLDKIFVSNRESYRNVI